MGYYVETPGAVKGKAVAIALMPGVDGKVVDVSEARLAMEQGELGVVCVVDNNAFEAAAYCYNMREFEDFQPTPTDHRNRTWIVGNKDVLAKLADYHG